MPLNLDLLKMGYFISYKSDDSFFSKAIVKKQLKDGIPPENACYSHVEVSGGKRHSINISPPISKLVDITKAHRGRSIRITRLKGKYLKRYKVAYFSASLCNKGYDVKGILSFLFRWVKQDNRLFFCSEGCAWALQKVYPEAFNAKSPDKIMPGDFSDPRFFEIVWEGKIS